MKRRCSTTLTVRSWWRATEPLDFPAAELLGHTEAEESLTINGEKMPLEELYQANTETLRDGLSR